MKLLDYWRISRPDNIAKHIFIIPGIVLAIIYQPFQIDYLENIFLGILSSILAASANYTINEFVDHKTDRFHPLKKNRALLKININKNKIITFYFSLVFFSILLAINVNKYFTYTILAFLFSGIIYNIKPFEFKNKIYLDILNEALNNPIRLFLGWYMIFSDLSSIPPASFILFYFFVGAFLMTSKRLSEIIFFKKFGNIRSLIKYRSNYKYYDQTNLTIAAIFFLMLISFNSAIFLIKYRIELILVYPVITILFTLYFYMTIKSPEKGVFPEKVYLDKYIIILTLISFMLFFILYNFDMNFLNPLLK